MTALGTPRLHLRVTTSTSDRARAIAEAGAPHGTLVTAREQTAGRGRQGRRWSTPPGGTIAMSLVLRELPALPPLAAAVAVADAVGPDARIKWPNDVLVGGRKVAGILIEGRPPAGWLVLGIGVNVAVDLDELPPELRETAGTLGRDRRAIEPFLEDLLRALETRLAEPVAEVLDAWRTRDALLDRAVTYAPPAGGSGIARGVDDEGRLIVETASGERVALSAGEVHLRPA
jgi:BirA family biotin operon repressor/biotin-[acetyl-CoA-carboxylase] ligase